MCKVCALYADAADARAERAQLVFEIGITPVDETQIRHRREPLGGDRGKRQRSAAAQGTGVKFDFVKIFPWFVIFFLIAAIVNTWLFPAVGIGESVSDFLNDAGKFMIALAMAAIGLNTNIVKLIRTGRKPILLGLCCWIAIAAVSIGVQIAMGLW